MTEGNRPGRNEPCSCGSGKKYKQCCLAKDEAAERARRAEAEKSAPLEAPAEGDAEAAQVKGAPRAKGAQPWKRASGGPNAARGFARVSATRKVGSS